jgi:hypothetical protein
MCEMMDEPSGKRRWFAEIKHHPRQQPMPVLTFAKALITVRTIHFVLRAIMAGLVHHSLSADNVFGLPGSWLSGRGVGASFGSHRIQVQADGPAPHQG